MKSFSIVTRTDKATSKVIERKIKTTLATLLEKGITPPILISASTHSHTCGYGNADIFLNISEKKSTAPKSITNILMRNAEKYRKLNNARVGASLYTKTGNIYSFVEKPPLNRKTLKNDINNEFRTAINKDGDNYKSIYELLDCSTSIHAEMQAIISAIKDNELPYILATTSKPCLSCCRFLRLMEIPHVVYLEDKYEPSGFASKLQHEALDGVELALFEGFGGRVDIEETASF